MAVGWPPKRAETRKKVPEALTALFTCVSPWKAVNAAKSLKGLALPTGFEPVY